MYSYILSIKLVVTLVQIKSAVWLARLKGEEESKVDD